MSRQSSLASIAAAILLSLSIFLLTNPLWLSAQAGAAGGHVGGGTAGGGGLSGRGGGATGGIDVKDDLKDFHVALALQATKSQITQYALILKSTDAANASLRSVITKLSGQVIPSDLVANSAEVLHAVDEARRVNKQFLDSFSERQRFGLRELTRRLLKEDTDLDQQTRLLGTQASDPGVSVPVASRAAHNVESALSIFRSSEVELGQQMSIDSGQGGPDFPLGPVKSMFHFTGQPVEVLTSGTISENKTGSGDGIFPFQLSIDLFDLQRNILDVMRAQLGKQERCGERVEVQSARLVPDRAAALMVIDLHHERWNCFGGGMNEMAEGNGTIEVRAIPSVADDGTLRVTSQTSRVNAGELLSDALRTGSLGDEVRDKIANVLLTALRTASDDKILPAAAQGHASLLRAQFEGTGLGRITAVVSGEVSLTADQATLLHSQLMNPAAAEAPQTGPQ